MTVIEDTPAFRAPRPEVIDLRGAGSPPPTAVLADPTGRRAALLRTAGRVVAVVFVLWFCGLVVAGLGLLPLSDLPLAGKLGPTSEPTKLSALPRPTPPARRDLRPARPLAASRPAAARRTPATTPAPGRVRADVVHRQRPTAAAPAPPGRRLGTSQAPATTTPAATAPTAPGNSGTAPGRNRTTTTTTTTTTPTAPGRSGTAPGHDPTAIIGHGASGR